MKIFPNLAVGAIVYGAAGKSARVVAINGDLLTIDTPNGIRTISVSKVARVEPPPEPTQPKANIEPPVPLAVGDTVYYCGDRYWEQYRDMPLVLLELRAGSGWTARKPDGYYTTNLETRELSRSPVDRPKVKTFRSPQKGQWLKDWESEQRQKY